MLPIAKTGLVVTMLFAFIFSWKEFVMALLLTRTRITVVPVGISVFLGGFDRAIEWNLVPAATVTYVVPMFLVVTVLQKYVVRGLTLGAVKG